MKRIFNAADADQDGQLKGREFGQAVSMTTRAKVKDVLATADKEGYGQPHLGYAPEQWRKPNTHIQIMKGDEHAGTFQLDFNTLYYKMVGTLVLMNGIFLY